MAPDSASAFPFILTAFLVVAWSVVVWTHVLSGGKAERWPGRHVRLEWLSDDHVVPVVHGCHHCFRAFRRLPNGRAYLGRNRMA